MLKIFLVHIFFIIGINCFGQHLKNTDWSKVKAERKDGSRIIDHSGLENAALRYIFKDSTVLLISAGQFIHEHSFAVKNNVLSIGEFIRYSIDTLNSALLVLTEIPENEKGDDKTNRLVFLNSLLHFRYLVEKKQIELLSDSLVLANKHFTPVYNEGRIDKLVIAKFQPLNINTIITGSFILTPFGEVIDVEIIADRNFGIKDITKFKEAIQQTSKSWTFPKGRKQLYYKIDFVSKFVNKPPFSTFMIVLHTQDPKDLESKGPTLQQFAKADDHFNKGLILLTKDKPEKALIEFDKCIKADSLYIDAYYNKVYSYLKLDNKNSACITLNLLKLKGQRQAEKLYNENCNN